MISLDLMKSSEVRIADDQPIYYKMIILWYPCLVRFCVVRIWIVRVLKYTPDLHTAYYGFLAFSDHLYYSGTCVVRFYIVWFCIVRTFFGYLGRTMQGPTVLSFCNIVKGQAKYHNPDSNQGLEIIGTFSGPSHPNS